MSRIASPYLLALTLLLGFHVAAQTMPQATPQATPQTSPQATPPASQQQPSMAQTPSAAEPSAQDEARDRLQRLGTALNLTDDQKTKLQPILAGEIQQVRDLKANAGMTTEQKQAAFQQTLVADHAKVQAILTPEQQQKLADLKSKSAPPQAQQPPQK